MLKGGSRHCGAKLAGCLEETHTGERKEGREEGEVRETKAGLGENVNYDINVNNYITIATLIRWRMRWRRKRATTG